MSALTFAKASPSPQTLQTRQIHEFAVICRKPSPSKGLFQMIKGLELEDINKPV